MRIRRRLTRRLLIAGLSLAVLAGGGLALRPADAAEQRTPGGTGPVQSLFNTQCVVPVFGGGFNVESRNCSAPFHPSELWAVQPVEGTSDFRFVSQNGSGCLTAVIGPVFRSGFAPQAQPCNGGLSQRWEIGGTGGLGDGALFTVRNRAGADRLAREGRTGEAYAMVHDEDFGVLLNIVNIDDGGNSVTEIWHLPVT